MLKLRKLSPQAVFSVALGIILGGVFLPDMAFAGPPLGPDIGSLGCKGANSLGLAICNVIFNSMWVPGLITAVAYLTGMIFAVSGVLKLKEHVLKPDQVSIWEPAKRFVAGGALFALPIVFESLRTTIMGSGWGSLWSHEYTGFAGETSGAGLDTVVVALAADLWQPIHWLLSGFSYLAGMIFAVIGVLRLVKTAQDGPRGPGGFGTIMTFLTAGILFSLDGLMGAFNTSVFGDEFVSTFAAMQFTDGMTTDEVDHVHAVISGVLAFIALVGWVSFIRGWFILRDVAEGKQQASMMAAVTHIFAGALAVNMGGLLNLVQETFGVSAVGICFSCT